MKRFKLFPLRSEVSDSTQSEDVEEDEDEVDRRGWKVATGGVEGTGWG